MKEPNSFRVFHSHFFALPQNCDKMWYIPLARTYGSGRDCDMQDKTRDPWYLYVCSMCTVPYRNGQWHTNSLENICREHSSSSNVRLNFRLKRTKFHFFCYIQLLDSPSLIITSEKEEWNRKTTILPIVSTVSSSICSNDQRLVRRAYSRIQCRKLSRTHITSLRHDTIRYITFFCSCARCAGHGKIEI